MQRRQINIFKTILKVYQREVYPYPWEEVATERHTRTEITPLRNEVTSPVDNDEGYRTTVNDRIMSLRERKILQNRRARINRSWARPRIDGHWHRAMLVVTKRDRMRQILDHFHNMSIMAPDPSPIDFQAKDIPMVIEGRNLRAQHDTGAESGNFISHQLVKELRLDIRCEKGDRKPFVLGNGKVIRAIGIVEADCTFANDAGQMMRCSFHVFEQPASPLIMGIEFLRTTQTLTNFRHRLANRVRNAMSLPMVKLIGHTTQDKRLFGAFIDDRPTLINADSGSDIDVMSPSYAKRYGYRVDRRAECRKRVRLADASVTETIGQVEATLSVAGGSYYSKTFDVLPGLTSDVILGEGTLDEINAFTKHENSFSDVFAGQRHSEFNVLCYLGRVNEYLSRKMRYRQPSIKQKGGHSPHNRFPRADIENIVSPAKQLDDTLAKEIHADDQEAHRLESRAYNINSIGSLMNREDTNDTNHQAEPANDRGIEDHRAGVAPTIPPRSVLRDYSDTHRARRDIQRRRLN